MTSISDPFALGGTGSQKLSASSLDTFAAGLRSVNTRISRWLLVIASISTALVCLVIGLEVLSRFVLNESFSGSIEICELLMVLMTFTIMPYVQMSSGQISVDIVIGRLSPRYREPLQLFHRLVSLGLFMFLAVMMLLAVPERYTGGDITYDLGVPVWIFMGIAGVLMGFLALTLFGEVLESLSTVIKTRAWLALGLVLAVLFCFLAGPFLIKGAAFLPPKLYLGALGFACLLLLLLVGMPIGVAMGFLGCAGIILVHARYSAGLALVGASPYSTTAQFVLTVMPMFILMGELCSQANISQDLFRTASLWFGHLPGGLAVAAILGCAGFAAVCGESMATAVTMGIVALPEMRRHKYEPPFACATLAAGGTLGILIPPSTGFIWYAIITENSVGKLFIAGILPGLLLAALFCSVAVGTALLRPDLAPRGAVASWSERLRATGKILPMVILILLVLGGILKGFFNPTEGGAVGALGALVYAIGNRTMTLGKLWHALVSTAVITGKILLILIGVYILGFFMAATQLPQGLAAWILDLGVSRYAVLAIICGIYIFLGMLINVIPMMLLTLPALYPTVIAMGFDPVWFGVIMVVLMEMGLISPPVGLNVFAMNSAVPEVSLSSIYWRVIPYFVAMGVCIAILTIFPSIALWLPDVLLSK